MLKPEYIMPYLPHSLKVVMEGKKTNIAWISTKNIAVIRPNSMGELKKINWKYAHLNIKPILRPLSDFAGKRTGGEVSKELDCTLRQVHEIWNLQDGSISLEDINLGTYEVMNRNHIDYNKLIEKGLAIDINNQ